VLAHCSFNLKRGEYFKLARNRMSERTEGKVLEVQEHIKNIKQVQRNVVKDCAGISAHPLNGHSTSQSNTECGTDLSGYDRPHARTLSSDKNKTNVKLFN
jgi:hypothetical protein